MAAHTTLHINCTSEQKQAWMLTARIAGMSFEDWVISQLNQAIIDPSPAWLDGLSEPARICLLSAGFNSRESLLQAIASGLDISSIPNAGYRVKQKVESWLK